MKQGDQVIYVPSHARNKGINHKDIEYGFVYSVSPTDSETLFCRYWIKGDAGVLRTVANSEATNLRDLRGYDSVSPGRVAETIEMIKKEKEIYGG